MAVQAECAAFLRGVAAGFASAVAVPHHRVVVTVIASPPESTMPCPATGRYNHVVEAETVTRRVIMGDAAAVFFALALEIVSAQGALAVRTAARGRAEVRFFDGEPAARRELADAERFIMGNAHCALDMVSALGGITDRTEFFDCEAASRRDIEDAAFAPFPHVPAAAGESSPVITVDPRGRVERSSRGG